jgi:Rap1a immunity proteins
MMRRFRNGEEAMRNLILAGLAILAVLSLSVPAVAADGLDGNKLYARCTGKEDVMGGKLGELYCFGYVRGIADAIVIATATGANLGKYTACIPTEAQSGQLLDIVKNYLAAHPETRHFGAAYLTMIAFTEGFPCKP